MRQNNNIPKEVMEVRMWQYVGYVGSETMEKIQDIMNRYPEWFPWEAKYNKIPLVVHQEFREKEGKALNRDWKRREKARKILYENMGMNKKQDKFTLEVIGNTIEWMMRKDDLERKLLKNWQKTRKKLWKKHYGEYDLEYRE